MIRVVTAFACASLTLAPLTASAQFACRPSVISPLPDTGIVGTVVESGSGRPIPSVHITLDGGSVAYSDCDGRFAIRYNIPDGKHRLSTGSPYFKPQSVQVLIAGPEISTVRFTLELRPPSAQPRLDLAGRWVIAFSSESGPRPGPVTHGRLAIGPASASRLGADYRAGLTVNLCLLRGRAAGSHSGQAVASCPDLPEDTVGIHAAGDSVEILLTPRTFDGGWSFRGRVRADSVVGYWCAHNFGHTCERVGPAVMTRQ